MGKETAQSHEDITLCLRQVEITACKRAYTLPEVVRSSRHFLLDFGRAQVPFGLVVGDGTPATSAKARMSSSAVKEGAAPARR